MPSFVFFITKVSESHKTPSEGTCRKAAECIVCSLEHTYIKLGAGNILAHKSLTQKLKGKALLNYNVGSSVCPYLLLVSVIKSKFTVGQQEDALEFLQCLLSTLAQQEIEEHPLQ